jgi:hypothetical protein
MQKTLMLALTTRIIRSEYKGNLNLPYIFLSLLIINALAQHNVHIRHDPLYCWRGRRLMASSGHLSAFVSMGDGNLANVCYNIFFVLLFMLNFLSKTHSLSLLKNKYKFIYRYHFFRY